MKNLLFLFFLLPLMSRSQRLHLDLYGGISNYLGELADKPYLNSQAAFGIGLSYDASNKFIVKTALVFGSLQGDDVNKLGKKVVPYRNLNFQTKFWDLSFAFDYNIFDLSEKKFTPYFFAGAAIYHFDPYSFNTRGVKVYLQPLSTEGQGLPRYPDKKPYKLTQLAIPYGGGIKYAVSDLFQVGLEIGVRKLFNDYLDDVSGKYADSATLFAAKGQQAIDFSYKGRLLPGAPPYPVEGAQRGNPKEKDLYYLTVVKISYLLGSGNDNGRRSKTGCPVRIY